MKKCLISFNWGQIWRKFSHRGQYFSPIFVCIEFGFAPMFPFNMGYNNWGKLLLLHLIPSGYLGGEFCMPKICSTQSLLRIVPPCCDNKVISSQLTYI